MNLTLLYFLLQTLLFLRLIINFKQDFLFLTLHHFEKHLIENCFDSENSFEIVKRQDIDFLFKESTDRHA